ncbi:unnamed protein product [Closterium sp. NIES-54]
MEVARTSMMHAAAPHFLWPFPVRYTAHQLYLWPRVSLPETSPTLRWTREVGYASVFRVWGSRAFVRDTSADKLFVRAIPCVFLGFPPDAPGWQFYHPTSRRVFPSQDVMFDESVPFSRLFPYRSAPPPPLPLFLALGPPSVYPPPPQGLAPSGVSQVDPLPELGGAEPEGAGSEGAGSGGAEPGGAEPAGAEPGGAEPEGVGRGGSESRGAESGGAEPWGTASSGGPTGASPHTLSKWFAQHTRFRSGAAGAGDSAVEGTGAGGIGATRLGGAGVTAGAVGTGVAAAAGPGGARTRGTGAAGSGTVEGARGAARDGAADPVEPGGAGAGVAGAGGTGVGGAVASATRAVDAGARGTGAGGTVRPRSFFVPLLHPFLSLPSSTGLPPSLLSPPPRQLQPKLQLDSPLPDPSPYAEKTDSFIEHRQPYSRPALPVRAVRTSRWIPLPRPPRVHGTHAMALRPSSVPLHVPLPPPPKSSLPSVRDPESDLARAASPTASCLLATVVTDPSFESAAASALVAKLVDFAAVCRLDYAPSLVAEPESTSPPSVGGECALGTDVLEDRQEDFKCLAAAVPHLTAMDAEMASWKSTGTYINAVPPLGANIVDGMWNLRVKQSSGSPTAFKARYIARGFSQPQGVDFFQTFSPTPKMTTLRVLLHVSTPLPTGHSLSAPPLDESIAPSGPYPELVGCLMYLMTCTRPDLAYPLSILARYVAPRRHRPEHWEAAKRVLRCLCSTSNCEAEICAGAMAAQELRWLTYLLTDFGERPPSSPVLYVDNKAMIALCQEHRTKHITLRYFLARELQHAGQRRLAYLATRANTADIFTKALQSCDHQRFCTVLGLVNLCSHVSLPETSPTLRWTGKVGDASVFRDVTFDESVPFYRLFPYRSAPFPPPLLFLALGPPAVDPLPPKGPSPSGVSQVEPLLGAVPVKVAVDSGAARGAASGGAESGGAEPARAEPGGAEPASAEPGGAEPGVAEFEGAESLGAEPRGSWSGAAGAGGSATGGTGAGGASVGGAGVPARAGGTGAGGAGAGGTGARGAGAGGTGAGDAGAGGAGAGDPGARGAGVADPGAGGAGGGGAASGGTGARGTVQWRPFFVPPPPSSLPPPESVLRQPNSLLPAPSPYAEQTDSFAERREHESLPALPLCSARTGRHVPRPPPVPGTHVMALRPSSISLRVPLPSPPASYLPDVPDPESDLARDASPAVPCLLATVVIDPSFESTAASAQVPELVEFPAACRLDYAASLVAESESDCPHSDGGECALGTDVLEDRQEDFECLAAAVPSLVAMLLAPEGDPDAPDIPTPRSYEEAITGPYSSQWQTAMDAEMASWKFTGTYVNAFSPPGANIVDGMWILRVTRQPGSPPVFKAR